MNPIKVMRAFACIVGFMTLVAIGSGLGGPRTPDPEQIDSLPQAPIGQVVHGTPQPKEDDPGFDCRTQGNRICGPKSNHPAGCYAAGVLVIPWTNYLNPKADPLYGQFESPC